MKLSSAHSILKIEADEELIPVESSTYSTLNYLIEFKKAAKPFQLNKQCPVLAYNHAVSQQQQQIGRQSTCPFDWVIDVDPNR